MVSLCLALGLTAGASAGWVTSGDNMYADVPGNVGIGTTNPAAKLAVEGNIDANNVVVTFPTTHEFPTLGFWGTIQGRYAKYFCSQIEMPDGDGGSPSCVLKQEAFGFLAGGLTEPGPAWGSYTTSGIGVYGGVSIGSGMGVYGVSSDEGNFTNYGGYFQASGRKGRGVFGWASSETGSENYGGYFEAAGLEGIGAYGKGSIGVKGVGQKYDFYAAGPGINYGSESSIRWKRNVKGIENPLDKILELRGVSFDWDAEHGGKHDIGMIAEEVGKVLPEIVQYEDDMYASAMDYSKVTPLVLEAVKALKGEVDALRQEIAEKNVQIAQQHQQILELTVRVDRMRSTVSALSVQSNAGL